MDINELKTRLQVFASERDWDQYHTPKNLASALAVEAGELLEVFQWLTADESGNLGERNRERAEQEIADVAIYLIRLCDRLAIDLEEAIERKLEINAEKYPVALAKGNATKYDQR